MPVLKTLIITSLITLALLPVAGHAETQSSEPHCKQSVSDSMEVAKKLRGNHSGLSLMRHAQLQTCDRDAEDTRYQVLSSVEANALTHKKLPADE